MVNVNVCYTAFYKPGRLSDAIEEFQRASFAADPARFVDRLRVQPTHVRQVAFAISEGKKLSFYAVTLSHQKDNMRTG